MILIDTTSRKAKINRFRNEYRNGQIKVLKTKMIITNPSNFLTGKLKHLVTFLRAPIKLLLISLSPVFKISITDPKTFSVRISYYKEKLRKNS